MILLSLGNISLLRVKELSLTEGACTVRVDLLDKGLQRIFSSEAVTIALSEKTSPLAKSLLEAIERELATSLGASLEGPPAAPPLTGIPVTEAGASASPALLVNSSGKEPVRADEDTTLDSYLFAEGA